MFLLFKFSALLQYFQAFETDYSLFIFLLDIGLYISPLGILNIYIDSIDRRSLDNSYRKDEEKREIAA